MSSTTTETTKGRLNIDLPADAIALLMEQRNVNTSADLVERLAAEMCGWVGVQPLPTRDERRARRAAEAKVARAEARLARVRAEAMKTIDAKETN